MRIGGRTKGTPNKVTKDLAAIAERLQVDPFEVLCLFAKGDGVQLGYSTAFVEPALRMKAAAEATRYLYPQRKALEHTTGDEGFRIVIEDYSKK